MPRRRLPRLHKPSPRWYSFDGTDGIYPSGLWSRPPTGTSTGQRNGGTDAQSWHGLQNHPSGHADHAVQLRSALTAHGPTPGWCKPPTGTSTGQPAMAGPMAVARSSKSPRGHADHAAQLRRHGRLPAALRGLVQATDGNFYGTTSRWRDSMAVARSSKSPRGVR